MKKILLSLAVIICAAYTAANAQETRIKRCSTTEYTDYLRSQDPGLDARMADVEVQMQKWLAEHIDANQRTSSTTILIPVIVHVVYNVNFASTQNISDDLVKSQIDVLNEDYGGYNSDAVKIPPFFRDRKAGDTGIRFQLAVRDPSGNVTNGIRRVSTTVNGFTQNNAVKYTSMGGDNAWPCTSYMNIWVCKLGGGIIGYGQFPGGSCATDGVVLHYEAFGRISSFPSQPGYTYGRTTTHEISHCLNLRHIWGDDANLDNVCQSNECSGSDLVADTPNACDANFGAHTCHVFDCNNQPTGDMYMNYMDYTDDKYLYMFTAGQATRMISCINTYRSSLLTSLGCTPVNPPPVDASISDIVSPGGVPCDNTDVSFIPVVTLTNFGSTPLTTVDINSKLDLVTAPPFSWAGTLAPGTSTNVSLPSQSSVAGDHLFYAWTSNPNGTIDGTPANDKTQRNFIGHAINVPYPITQGFETLPFPPANWSNKNYDCGTAWARTTTAARTGTSSAYFNNFIATTVQNGVMDEIVTQPFDMTNGTSSTVLTFWKAYAPKSATGFDTLEVLVSTDCGYNFTSVYKDWGTTLATAPAQTTAFVPTSAQWGPVNISLAPFVGVKNLIIAFRNINHGGNNLYIDDMNVTEVGINENIPGVTLNVYPNPTEGLFNVSTIFVNPAIMQIIVTDALGQMVYKTTPKTTIGELTTIDLRNASKGIYFVELKTEKGSIVKKVSLSN